MTASANATEKLLHLDEIGQRHREPLPSISLIRIPL
jgi:hypothetical protein